MLQGEDGRDTLRGDEGDDRLLGGKSVDRLFGNDGHDKIQGEEGGDLLWGGAGNDRLEGGMGRDTLLGGAGDDVFVFTGGRDLVLDFEDDHDTIRIDDALWKGADLSFGQVLDRYGIDRAHDVVLDFGGGNRLRVVDCDNLQVLLDDLAWV